MMRHRHGSGFGLIVFGMLAFGGYLWARGDGGNVAVFGGNQRRVAGDFTGTQAGTLFGGQKFDFREAEIPGRQAVLTLRTAFGGAEILVPDHWNVIVENTAIFGGVEDKTRHPRQDANGPDLIIDGLTLFGGIEIRN